ncbi:MAG: flagellar basal body-associated FliL family protein [Bdellovibrionales bacterium]
MAETEVKSAAPSPDVKPDEVSLEEIDRLLEADDPEFTKSLDQIKEVGVEGEVTIESAVPADESLSAEAEEEKQVKYPRLAKLLKPWQILKTKSYTRWLRLKNFAVISARQLMIHARTLPVEFFGYLKSTGKAVLAMVRQLVGHIRALSWGKRLAWLGFLGFTAGALILLKMNIGGVWLPGFNEAIITDMTHEADQVHEINANDPMVSLFRAFPQEEIEFLFPKVIVNLSRTPGHPNPMGAFEFYAVLDSKDVALEVKARREELHDRLQRALEGQTYGELTSPLGKKRVKDLLRRELNDVLSQGWVKDILIKTMVIKP